MSDSQESLLNLPFDQYSRQRTVQLAVENVIKDQKDKLKILDVGGHKGKTTEFHPDDNVTVIDVFDESYEGYVKGDATHMEMFKDNEFDVVVSFDVLEHIAKDQRSNLIKEALRVSKTGAFLAFPVDDKDHNVSAAEMAMNSMFKDLYGTNHEWLKEHIDYGIPTQTEVEKLIKKCGARSTSVSSNNLQDWVLLQTAIFIAAKSPSISSKTKELSRWFNSQNQQGFEEASLSYRRIYFVSSQEDPIDKVDSFWGEAKTQQDPYKGLDLMQKVVEIIGENTGHLNQKTQDLLQQRNEVSLKLSGVEQRSIQLEQELNALKGSVSWRLTKPLRQLRAAIKGRHE